MAKHEYYVVQGKTLNNIAETMKTVLGVDKDTPIRFDEITNNEKAEQVTESVDVQTEVIEQIKAALNGKSSIGVKEIMNIIDQSGVLDSTDGTATEKVEQLIDYADLFKKARGISFHNSNIETITMDCSHLTNLNGAFDGCRKIKEIHLSNTQNVKTWQYFLYSCNSLTTLETLDLSGRTNVNGTWAIGGIDNLRTFKVEPNTILVSIIIPAPKLTDGTDGTFNSIQSIIDGLAIVETAQTLTLHADVKAKLTEEQLVTITNKNWNLA